MASRLDQKSVREGTIQAHKNETNFSGNLLSRQHSMPFNILKGQNKYQICGYQDKQPLFGLWFRLDVLLSGWKGVWESERDCQICVCVDIYVAMLSIFRIGGTFIYVMALFFSLFILLFWPKIYLCNMSIVRWYCSATHTFYSRVRDIFPHFSSALSFLPKYVFSRAFFYVLPLAHSLVSSSFLHFAWIMPI